MPYNDNKIATKYFYLGVNVMNETIHTLITRRSVRKYKKAQISDEDLYMILQAGTYAASGHGLQPCTIVVIQDTDTLARLSALNAKIMGTTSDPMYGAPTVLLVLADMKNPPTPGPTAASSWAIS